VGRVAQRIDAAAGTLSSEFDTSIFSLTAIPVLGFWKLLPTFGGCVITVSSAKMTENHVIEMEVLGILGKQARTGAKPEK
jgi:hypothetical protein